MSFQAPLFLLGLVLLPALAVLYGAGERRRRRAQAAYVDAPLLPSLAPRRAGWRRHVPVAACLLATGALVLAAARPATSRAVPVEQATIVIATDRSGSMLSKDVAPSRLVAARRAAETFVDAVPKDVRVGAIAFNHEPSVLQSPTRDHAAVIAALRSVTAAGSTATGDALARALQLIRSARAASRTPDAPAAIVLLSDGKSVRGQDALTVAAAAARAKVKVYTVALGTQSGTIVGRTASGGTVTRAVPPDPQTLAAIAKRTGGETFAIKDAGELDRVYEKLGSQLATEQRPQDQAGLMAGGALLLLLSGVGASLRWFGRLL